jgi:hypothetical protein
LPAYAPNFTVRIKVRYHAAGANHTQLWRCQQVGVAHVNLDAAIAAIQGVYDLLTPIMKDDWAVLDVSYADINSDVFLPTTGLTAIGTVTTVGMAASEKAQAVSFVGRTLGGQPAKFAQFGVDTGTFANQQALDYRISAGEDTTIDGVIALLNTYSSPLLITGNDILGIVWKDYANTKPYDFWVKKVRSGG